MSTGWRLRPGTVVVEVAPSRSAGTTPSRSAGKPKRKAPSPCSRSVRRRTSGTDAVPQVAKVRTPKQDNEATRKRCVRPQDAVIVTVYESRWWSLPGARCLVPSGRCPLPGTWVLLGLPASWSVPCAWCPVPGAWCPAPCCGWGSLPFARCLVLGARCPVPAAWLWLEVLARCLVPGARCLCLAVAWLEVLARCPVTDAQ